MRNYHKQSGQSVIEIALLLPVLLMLAFGVIEVGRYASLAIVVGNAAEAGAVYGAQSLPLSVDQTGIQNAALNDGQNITGLSVTTTHACGCDSGGSTVVADCFTGARLCSLGQHWVVNVQVTATGHFHSLFKYPGVPQTLDTSRTVSMRVKQ